MSFSLYTDINNTCTAMTLLIHLLSLTHISPPKQQNSDCPINQVKAGKRGQGEAEDRLEEKQRDRGKKRTRTEKRESEKIHVFLMIIYNQLMG